MKSFMKAAAKQTFRASSHLANRWMVGLGLWQTQHQISEGLFLGMIPVKDDVFSAKFDDEHIQIIKMVQSCHVARPLKLVVSAVEEDEMAGKGFLVYAMVSPADWKKENVDHHLIAIPDMGAKIDNKSIIDTITKMRDCIEKNGSVYAHCKAGRGRSAMLCAIYLALYGSKPLTPAEMTLDDAIILLQSKRPQVSLHESQKLKAAEIINIMKSTLKHIKKPVDSHDAKTAEAPKQSAADVAAAASASPAATDVAAVKKSGLGM